MSIEKRPAGNGGFRVRWREDGRSRSKNFPTYEMAVQYESERIRRKYLGGFAPEEPSGETMGAWLATWQERYGPEWAATTTKQRSDVLRRWVIPIIGTVALRDFGPNAAAQYRTDLIQRGVSPKTINSILRVLSAALGRAVAEQRIPSNPLANLRAFNAPVIRPRALVPEQIEAIRRELPTDRDRLLVSLLAYAGMRPAEAIALPWANVSDLTNGDRATIYIDRSAQYGEIVPTKTRAARTLTIEDPLLDDLRATPRGADHELVVPALGGTNRWEPGGIINWKNWNRRVFAPAAHRAGVVAVPYDLRHTFASLLIHEGRPVPYVSAALGHASSRMTLDRYAHVFEDARLRPAVSLADAVRAVRSGGGVSITTSNGMRHSRPNRRAGIPPEAI